MLLPTIALVLASVAFTYADCPNGFVHHDNSCYHFSHDLEDWAGAQAVCKALGATLVEIDDDAEAIFLTSQVKLNRHNYWTAGNDLATEGDWSWLSTGTRLSTSFTHWARGQPDNYRKNQNCMLIASNGYWYDNACNQATINYICELPGRYGTQGTVPPAMNTSAPAELVG